MKTSPSSSVLQDELLQTMASHGGVRNFAASSVLINEEDENDALFILLSGRVKVFGASSQGREVIYNTLGPGEYFGEMSLDGGPRSASVMTLEPCTCVVVPGAKVRDFLASHPDFALHLVHKLIGLVRRATDSVKSLALDDVYSRVVRLLNEKAHDEDGRRVVADRLTQREIADHVGSSREMISRIFTQLVQGGYIAVEDRRIFILKKLPAGW
ncbi:Crp/Fnr family transcriptional regulator [Niveibacterium sp. SC-1]|uniref:Crp/Fnr family transcriptional regulator n=1 Tax=Niveibacterium sp. SC-1 TaxID=3135646 RepID=UPI00311FE547